MRNIKKYANIVDAIKYLEPDNVLTNCLSKNGYAIRHHQYRNVQLEDGRKLLIEYTGKNIFYRGENKIYPSCKSSLYRKNSREDQICALLKTYDFIIFLISLPETLVYVSQDWYIDFWALAQHYEFATPMIDLTNDIAVAAFFATHYYDKVSKRYLLIKEGKGRILYMKGVPSVKGALKPIGEQPYARPGRQAGYAYWPGEGDLTDLSSCVEFDQDYEINLKLDRAMLSGEDWFFPSEQISLMAMLIRNQDIITNKAIDFLLNDVAAGNEYIKPKVTRDEIMNILKNRGMFITDAPLVVFPESIPPQGNPFMDLRMFVTKPAYQKGKIYKPT